MAGFIGDEQVRKIKEATDLVALVAEYVPVLRSGHNFKACCPFHNERTPSFYVYTDNNDYHCFGCGAHGDVITFVMEKENLEFTEAVELLARRAHIEIEYEKTGKDANRLTKTDRERYLEVMERSTALYETYLWDRKEGAEARAYLADRGLTEETCRAFRLGWAPGNNTVVRGATRSGVSAADLIKLNIGIDRNGQLADRFYNRLMFPICDRFGQPIAYSGRLLPAAERAAKEAGRGVGKYINSTDTPLYRKGNIVFNLHRARRACRDAGRLIIMEGPTDVMAAAQAGDEACVAVLGTALTAEHARQMGNAVGGKGTVLLLFDGDQAGQTNSVKAVRTCLSCGLPTRVAVLPEGADPADLLGGGQVDEFEQALTGHRADIAHLLRTVAPRPHALQQHELWQIIDGILEVLRPIQDDDQREGYLDQVAHYLGVDFIRLQRRLAADDAQNGPVAVEELDYDVSDIEPAVPLLDKEQETVLHVLVRHPDLRPDACDNLGVEPALFPRPWADLIQCMIEQPEAAFDVLQHLPGIGTQPAVREALFRWRREDRTRYQVDVSDAPLALAAAARSLVVGQLGGQITSLEHDLVLLQQDGDHQGAGQLFQELMELRRRHADLQGSELAEG